MTAFTNPRLLVLFAALIIVSGLVALKTLPRTEDPSLTVRFGTILTTLPGASAERVEALVTEKIENQLRTMPEILHLESLSSQGLSQFSVTLIDEVPADEVSQTWSKVREEIESVIPSLPANASKPRLDNKRGEAYTLILGVHSKHQQFDDTAMLGRYAKELENIVRGVAGTDHVLMSGLLDEEVVVEVDYDKALSLGLTIADISQRINASDAKVSAGELVNRHYRMALEVRGALDNEERIRRIALTGESQAVVSVGDIATVTRQPKTPADSITLINGQRGVAVAVRMQASNRGDYWLAEMKSVLEDFRATLPDTVRVTLLFDQQVYTADRLNDLVSNVLLGFLLITLVLLVSLGWRSALLVSAALPLTILFSLACMKVFGLPIHQMSVSGLIIALGIMVDNAIVMVDTVARFKRQGMSGLQSSMLAVRRLWLPLLGSTVTTVLTFMPIILMPGNGGEFVRGVGLTVVFSLIGSYLISHILVAGLAGRLLTHNAAHHWSVSGVKLPALSARLADCVRWSTARPAKVMLLVACLPLLGLLLVSRIPEQFFPPSDRDMINFELYLPASASITETQRVAALVDTELEKITAIESRQWFIGGNAPSFYYNLIQRNDRAQYYAQAMLTVSDFREANRLVPIIQRQFDNQFPDVQIIVRRLEQGPPFNAPVEIRVYGPSLEVLAELGDQLRQRLLMTDHVVHARSTLSDAVPKAWLELDETILLSLGLSLTDVAVQTRLAIDGAAQASVLEQTELLPVRVSAKGFKTGGIEQLVAFPLRPHHSLSGQAFVTPLSSLGNLHVTPIRSTIARRDGSRVNTVEAYLRDGVLPASVLADIQQQLKQKPLALPAGYRLEVGGESEQRALAVSQLMSNFMIIVVLLIVALVMAFNSFRLAAIIIIVAVQAAALGILALTVSGFAFGFTSIIGLMALIGLAINAAIVIIAELQSCPLARRGDQQAIVRAVMHCSRHITSTTITTCMGFLPLLLGGGGFWPPFGIIIAGGTLLTSVVSFFFVPAVFQWLTIRWPLATDDAKTVADG